ncbi:hypothetical protein NBRC111894_3919 [Sporolactobacillus inulinus]|uniref:Uncharacterized protein n=1 Tax=Sporolactobacillus inulinus TaxID=2078 RepID=A0A4Y1ZGW4_9BACL|nr:hypothetical protein NBRC111894_3919 [Sporolactobacillus inulinus]
MSIFRERSACFQPQACLLFRPINPKNLFVTGFVRLLIVRIFQ